MLKHIHEYERWVEITGFTGIQVTDAKALSEAISGKLPEGCEVQLFNADLVATWQHLYFAAVNALMNQKSGRGISKSLAVETALYASAQRQIKKALELIGLKPNCRNAAVLIICDKEENAQAAMDAAAKVLGTKPNESVLELSPAKVKLIREAFDITEAELSAISKTGSSSLALVDLVLERVALLSTKL